MYENKAFNLIIIALGSYQFLKYTYLILTIINRQMLRTTFFKSVIGCTRKRDHLYRKYATPNGSVAVVTGGSDGIGLAMCYYLASQGFNICIVARD